MEVAINSRSKNHNINSLLKKTVAVPIGNTENQVKHQMEIIIVDDDEDDQEFLAEAISEFSSNIKVRFAGNGKELMKQLGELALPDLVFLDLNMPLMNGFECLALIKKDPKFKDLPVLIYSTSANPEQIEKTFQEGAYFYIQKPNNIAQLKTIVKKVMVITKDHSTNRPNRKEFLIRS
ncbi:response regulator [Aquiflexum sp.]|uniref:response regulator n=1 Tax=Aquiflexum sp. TaxID=1872584 RepID=UPI0035938809